MAEQPKKSLLGEIDTSILYHISQIPSPTLCTISKIYEDQNHVDITTSQGELEYVPTIANNLAVGNIGVLIFLNGNSDEYIVITK